MSSATNRHEATGGSFILSSRLAVRDDSTSSAYSNVYPLSFTVKFEQLFDGTYISRQKHRSPAQLAAEMQALPTHFSQVLHNLGSTVSLCENSISIRGMGEFLFLF